MRRFVLSLCRGLLCTIVPFISLAQQTLLTTSLQQKSQEIPTLPSNVSRSWYQQAMQHLQEREYFLKSMDNDKAFGAINRAQRIAFYFSEQGYRVKQFTAQQEQPLVPQWEAEF